MSDIVEYTNKIFVERNGLLDATLIAVLTQWAAYPKFMAYIDERIPVWSADVFYDIDSFQQSCQHKADACAKGLMVKRWGKYGTAPMTAEQCSQRYNKAYRNAKALELLVEEFDLKIFFSPATAVEPHEMAKWVELYWGTHAREGYEKSIHNDPSSPDSHLVLTATTANIGNMLRLLRILYGGQRHGYWRPQLKEAVK